MTTANPVLPRPHAARTTRQLISAYAAGPGRLRQVFEGLSFDEMRARPRPGKWSMLEIALHLVDGDLVGLGRIKFAYAQPGSPLLPYDQDVWASAFDYHARSLAELEQALRLFESLRGAALALFGRVNEQDWERCGGVHGERGPQTLREILEMYAEHGERHIAQIVTLRSLIGRSIELPPVLAA